MFIFKIHVIILLYRHYYLLRIPWIIHSLYVWALFYFQTLLFCHERNMNINQSLQRKNNVVVSIYFPSHYNSHNNHYYNCACSNPMIKWLMINLHIPYLGTGGCCYPSLGMFIDWLSGLELYCFAPELLLVVSGFSLWSMDLIGKRLMVSLEANIT